jgi:hypothetical protein
MCMWLSGCTANRQTQKHTVSPSSAKLLEISCWISEEISNKRSNVEFMWCSACWIEKPNSLMLGGGNPYMQRLQYMGRLPYTRTPIYGGTPMQGKTPMYYGDSHTWGDINTWEDSHRCELPYMGRLPCMGILPYVGDSRKWGDSHRWEDSHTWGLPHMPMYGKTPICGESHIWGHPWGVEGLLDGDEHCCKPTLARGASGGRGRGLHWGAARWVPALGWGPEMCNPKGRLYNKPKLKWHVVHPMFWKVWFTVADIVVGIIIYKRYE